MHDYKHCKMVYFVTQCTHFQTVMRFHVSRQTVIPSTPSRKACLPSREFHEIKKPSTTVCAHLLHRISPKSNNRCGKYGQKLTYAHRHNASSAAPIFTKRRHCTENFCAHLLHVILSELNNNAENTSRIFIYFLHKIMSRAEKILTKLAPVRRHYVKILYIEFSPKSAKKFVK
jgi:hypothetical protein